jgi:alcohol dehydrogenase
VVAIDLSDDKLRFAEELGATDTVNAMDPDAVQRVRSLSDGGVDFAFELAGSVSALDTAYHVTRRGGTTVTAGLPHPDARLALSPVTLVAEERTLRGSYIGTAVPSRDIPRYIAMYRRGMLPVNRLLSGSIGLEDLNEGFDRLHDGSAVRQIVVP